MDDKLLAVLQLPKEDRIRCQLNECNHPVYKRVHVVLINSELFVIGSECFKKHFEGKDINEGPIYTSSQGKCLTEEERELLKLNTQKLVESLRIEHELEIQRIEAEKRIEEDRKALEEEKLKQLTEEKEQKKKSQGLGHPSGQYLDRRVSSGAFRPEESATYGGTFAVSSQGGRNDDQGQSQLKSRRKIEEPIDHQIMAKARDIINKQFREERGINPELPGFAGWAKSKAEQLYLDMIEQ